MFTGTLGFLGFGNMGHAVARGLIDTQTFEPGSLAVYDVDSGKTRDVAAAGVQIADSPEALAHASDALLLATKPQDMESALNSIRSAWKPEISIISIAAGISTGYIHERLDSRARVARVMPNTPALVGAGAAGISYSSNALEEDRDLARTVFGAVGIAVEVPEPALDAVTALSGSGPAYYFYLVECFVNAAVALGLGEPEATRLAGQTLLGAGKLLSESGEPAAVLRERVTSKGGTTAAALDVLKENRWPEIAAAALQAAARRSQELGQ